MEYQRLSSSKPRRFVSVPTLCLIGGVLLTLTGYIAYSSSETPDILIAAAPAMMSRFSGLRVRMPMNLATPKRCQGLRCFGGTAYIPGDPLDPALIRGDLPYNAKKEGFTAAIERASRNHDLAAVRKLEQARVEVIEKTKAGGSMGKWDEIFKKQQLERRKNLMDLSLKRRAKEDALVESLKSHGEFSLDSKDQFGLTIDVQKIVRQQAEALEKALRDGADDGARMVTMRTEIDPMPWWEELPQHMMEIRVAQQLKANLDIGTVAVLFENPNVLTSEPTDGLKIGRLSNPEDANGCDIVIAIQPECDTLDKMKRVVAASHNSNYGDVVIMGGNFGSPSDPEAKMVRQFCKDTFVAGLNAISFVMPPVKLVPNVGGEPYPLPQWLIDAGYKATGNVAITGNSGTGKSSLNNALRGLKPRDDGAAAVGVKETTLDPHGYDFEPAGPEMRLWDLPGAGTPKFPLDSYMRTMGIKYFDEVIIASAARFTETDLELMDELRMHGIPFIALRTKVDLEIRNAQQDSGASEVEILRNIRQDIKENSLLPDDRIYMVSARRPDDFDFQRLRQYIIKSLHRGLEVKLAKALNRKLEVQEIWNTVC